MQVMKESIAREFATTTPEDVMEFRSRLLNYRILIAILAYLKNKSDGGISQATCQRMVKQIAVNLGFSKGSVFYPVFGTHQ